MFSDRRVVRPTPQFQHFLLKNDFLTKEVTPLDPSQDPHRNSAQNDVLASSPSFFLDPFVTKTLLLFQTTLSKWLLGWGTTFQELKVLSKMATGVGDHFPGA